MWDFYKRWELEREGGGGGGGGGGVEGLDFEINWKSGKVKVEIEDIFRFLFIC